MFAQDASQCAAVGHPWREAASRPDLRPGDRRFECRGISRGGHPGGCEAFGGSEPGGVAAKRRRKAKGEPSVCLLVRVAAEGRAREISLYDALAAAGHIRPLGAEALEQ